MGRNILKSQHHFRLSNLILHSVVLLFVVTNAFADEPIPTGPDALTMHDYYQSSIAIETELFLEGYKKHGKRNDAWDDAAIHFIELFILCYSGDPKQQNLENLKAAGKAAIDLGCDDPLVLYGYGYAIDRQSNSRRGEKYLGDGSIGLKNSKYPAYLFARAAARLGRYLKIWNRHKESRVLYEVAANAFIRAAEETPDEYFQQRFLTNILQIQLNKNMPLDIAETLLEGLQMVGGLNSCTLNTCLGIYHERVGWEARGSGFANTVTEEGWEIFAKHQDLARSYLVKAHELDPTRPEAASYMIKIAMTGHAGPGESERFWFDKAVAAQMDWPPAYSHFQWAMRPRWSGSPEEMFEFGLECANTERFDTIVPYKLIKILIDIDSEEQYSRRFWRLNRVDKITSPLLEQLAADPKNVRYAKTYRTTQLGFLWALDNFEDAKKVLEQINYEPMAETLRQLRMSRRRILDDVQIFTGEYKEEVSAADSLSRVKDFKGAAQAYEKIIEEIDDDSKLMPILHDRFVTAKIEAQFKKGEWVDLKFEEGLPGWRNRGGVWHSSSPDSIKGGPQGNGLFLISKFDVGEQFELTGKIDLRNLPIYKSPNAGVVFQYDDNVRFDSSIWLAFQIYNRKKEAWIGYRFWKGSGEYLQISKPKTKDTYDFHLKSWGEEAVLYLNGLLIFADQIKIGRYFEQGQTIGLGSSYSSNSGYVLFENLKLRRLDERPEELDANEP